MSEVDGERLRALEIEVARLRGQVEVLIRGFGNGGGARMAKRQGAGREFSERIFGLEVLMGLTPKQHAVVQMLVEGLGTEEMAGVLGVHVGTVKVHIRGVMKRAGVRSRAQIMMMWREATAGLRAEEYEAFAGIPMDWAKRPEDYGRVTEMLRVKVR